MAIPKFEDFLYPFLTQLKDKDVSSKEMKDAMVQHFGLTEEDRMLYMLLSKSGMLDRFTRLKLGPMKVKNDRGSIGLAKSPEVPIMLFEWDDQTWKLDLPGTIPLEELTPTEQLESAYNSINDDLAADLLQKALEASPQFFEQLVLDLLLKMGYGGSNGVMAHVTPTSHDNGVDGIIPEDTLGLDKIYIQAKRYTDNPVGKPEIQQFVGALNEQKASKGVFVTTSTFTKGAIESVNKATSKIVLIDGKALAKYMIEYNVGVSTKKVYAIKKIDTDYFEE